MKTLSNILLLVGKDIRLELRTKQGIVTMTVFSILTVLLLAFAFEPGREETEWIGPGLLWIAFTFAGTIGLETTQTSEREEGALEVLRMSPVGRGSLYLGKLLANVILLYTVEVITLPLFAVLFNFEVLPMLTELLTVQFFGTIGFAAVGTILAAVTSYTKLRGVLLPVILFPMIVPVLLAAVEATAAAFRGDPMTGAMRLLVVYDIVFVTTGVLLFGSVLEE